ncbi:hypothetical protein CCC_00511 [Paramagnetospirillum magnetotacticum MS-1]|uniref:Bbp19-like phage domain-containing protein n=1 Tax=Paramagnetospirillum magnetotacticum MS-1 TaxID=272627 RepID=A0A0C2YRW9_PARME|nr:hypothetical protein [Paramagnetospirillum magnetotacticum]KIL97450.1 hypothetical protein CCC_00511 [Paramagnetospirillum magnetotacticum MS-1]
MPPGDSGWTWLDHAAASSHGDDAVQLLSRQAARLFATPDGEAVLHHLKSMTIDRCLGPESGDNALRHLEGQRHLVLHLLALAARGRTGM